MGHVRPTRVHGVRGSCRVLRAPAPEGVSAKIIAVLAYAASLGAPSPGAAVGAAPPTKEPCLMDRRRILLVVAAIIAGLGTLLVFLYVRGADQRADQKFHAVQVLKAVKQINIGCIFQIARLLLPGEYLAS